MRRVEPDRHHTRSVPSALRSPLALLLLGGLLMAGCSVGSYPIDIFQEMHYSQSYRTQEVPRLSPPASAEPFGAAGVGTDLAVPMSYDLLGFAEMADIENPLPGTDATLARARELFRIDCAGCHGEKGDGESFVSILFQGNGVQRPIDYATDETVLSRTDGELFWIITHGTEAISEAPRGNMPAFRKFQSTDDRWALVHLINAFQEGPTP